MKSFLKNSSGVVLTVILICVSGLNSCRSDFSDTEILWDNYGVPHIYARNNREMYYSFGWAQMKCHADLILRLYAEARGKASEYLGNEYAESDLKVLSFDLPRNAREAYEKQTEEYRYYIDAFVKGMNDYAAENREDIDAKYRDILPVTPYDILSHTIRVICLEFLAGGDIGAALHQAAPGSNSVAISPSKSASGNAMLITNPHLPWQGFFTWFEAHLNSPRFSAYGIALVGMPTLSIAFNNYLGWTHTVNTIDASDRFELTLEKGGYLLDGRVVPFKTRSITLRIRQQDGSYQEKNYEIKYSEHGPVLAQNGNKAWAVRIAGLENYRTNEQYHRMGSAMNLSEFESAVRMLQNPMFNIVYADRDGNIMYLFNGNVPRRPGGDFSSWNGNVDGTRSDYIWKEFLSYDELPRVLNPSSGFVQNCNDAPWTCTYPKVLDPSHFPAYLAPLWMGWRPQRAINMIRDNISISFDQLVEYKLNTGMETADRFLDDLLKAVDLFPDSLSLKAAEVLKKWDRKTECDSRGAILFAQWFDKLNNNMFKVQWDIDNPVTTPCGLKNEREAARLLSDAAGEVISKYGSLDISWGEINRLRMNGLDFPANGGPDKYGIFRTFYFVPDSDNKTRQVAGETYFAVTEFGKKVKAGVMLSYGNATQKGNKHIGDQLLLLSEKKMRPALLEKKEILKNLETKESLKAD